ncbi:MAG: Bbp16 family capsid cement protein [Marinobacterium sp.]
MYMDKQQMFSEDQAVTASAASTNVIDLGSADAGRSSMEVFARVSEAFNNLTSLGVKLQTATDAAFTTPVDLPAQETDLLAALTLNKEIFKAKLPQGCLRYVRLYFTVTGTAPTTGKITAGIILDRQANP